MSSGIEPKIPGEKILAEREKPDMKPVPWDTYSIRAKIDNSKARERVNTSERANCRSIDRKRQMMDRYDDLVFRQQAMIDRLIELNAERKREGKVLLGAPGVVFGRNGDLWMFVSEIWGDRVFDLKTTPFGDKIWRSTQSETVVDSLMTR